MVRALVVSFRYSLPLLPLLFLAACGGGGSNSNNNSGGDGSGGGNPPVIAVTISPASASLASGGTQQFQATVTGTSNSGVQWKVNHVAGGNTQYGTITSAGLYTAPTVSSGMQVSVTAVSAADSSKSASAAVTVSPVAITISPGTATLAVNSPQQFTATVTGTGNTGVTWSVDGVPAGTLRSARSLPKVCIPLLRAPANTPLPQPASLIIRQTPTPRLPSSA